MTKLRVMAIDDEALALRRIGIAIGQIEGTELVATARAGRAGLALIEKHKPDVLLLDINMPGFGGFEVVEGLAGGHTPFVIFVTAFDEHAVQAFQVSAIDYLLKPLEFDRLRAALDKARAMLRLVEAEERATELRSVLDALRLRRAAPEVPRYESEFWVPRGYGFERVLVSQIDWIQAERDYVRLHTAAGSHMVRETMTSLEARLDPQQLIRVHRSAFVRVDRIGSIRRGPGYGRLSLLLETGAEVPVGRNYARQIRQLINPALAEPAGSG